MKKHDPFEAELRSRLKNLKSKGLYKGDLRKPLTRYARRKAMDPEFAAVAAGKSRVIEAPSAKSAREYSGIYKTHGKKIILPADVKSARFDKKTGELKYHGAPLSKARRVGKIKPGQGRAVVVHAPGGKRAIFQADTDEAIKQFLDKYHHLDKYPVTIEPIDESDGE